MNAVLQCLSHTDILAEYFVLDQYKVGRNTKNQSIVEVYIEYSNCLG